MTVLLERPARRPARTHFSSGPCSKRPGWSLDHLANAFLGRSHRASEGKARLKLAIDKTRALLGVPDDFLCGIVPASDTGAYELAMWSMLGQRGVTALAWESFGKGWVNDAKNQLQLADFDVLEAKYGELPDLAAVDFSRDVLFTANGTTSGVRVPDYNWIAADREGLTFADATSAAFAQPIDWAKVDVVTFSWQKVMGGEAAHGMLILSPRAIERLETYQPEWPLPKIFRLTKKGKVDRAIFEGATINTPSMLCVEDYIDTLTWGERIGGLPALMARADANASVINDWVDRTAWIANLAKDPATRSNTSVCLEIVAPEVAALADDARAKFCKSLVKRLETEAVAYDIDGYRDAPPGIRIWTGATVDSADLEVLTEWLDWAFATEIAALTKAA
ncbi:MAG: phosphoserine transaminase [Alphaproteobacteria bacterium]|nr:phosphoserine transaminase [Alphaproteobacteria bacterium]